MYVLGYSGFTRDSKRGIGSRSPFAKTDHNLESILEFRDCEIPFSMFPLGYFGHDASAALLKDGKVIACVAEERFTRVKFSLNLAGNTLLPRHAIAYCLEEGGISMSDVDVVAHYCEFTPAVVEQRIELLRPFLTSEEVILVSDSFRHVYQRMMTREVVISQFEQMTGTKPVSFVPVRHHMAHAASAFYPSGFPEALVFTADGSGELESSMLAIGASGVIRELESVMLPTSLGTLYLIISVFLGFKSLGDEYKVMGLASYGDPATYRDVFAQLVHVEGHGGYTTSLLRFGGIKEFLRTRLGRERGSRDSIEGRHADIAASLQEAVNGAVLHTLRLARVETGLKDLCMAGGLALNCTMNGVIPRSGLFDRIFVQPAASDEGCSVGASMKVYADRHTTSGHPSNGWDHVYFGPSFGESEILRELVAVSDKVMWKKGPAIASAVADRLAKGDVVGWFQGRMEFGPRALGNRSILADPRNAGMKGRINGKVKNRESFRPFAPAVTLEDAREFFDIGCIGESPFMLFALPVWPEKQKLIPAVTHVDGSARVQTVTYNANPRFWELLQEFRKITGIPVLLNTSFNVRNEPIVCTPKDAIACFLSTHIDCIALGDFLVERRGSA